MEGNRCKMYLLKKEREGEDSYRQAAEKEGFDVHFVTLLEFHYVNQSDLAQRLLDTDAYSGLIITSQRAVTAMEKVWDVDKMTKWRDKKIYSFGRETVKSLAILLDVSQEKQHIIGRECINAGDLAGHISTTHTSHHLPLLFLCGNKRREELPRHLHHKNVHFSELIVYQTESSAEASKDMDEIFRGQDGRWIVFFSPSGVDIACLGPTTGEALESHRERLGISCTIVVSSKPNAPSLMEEITSHQKVFVKGP
ncbi:uroporphyrinogen-III synthase [Planoprotostelium fungivorum]|uniref:Uroporphyrinogen-III synthase n=1 Tax=Planoprotostelium fungivorum TaxID=1890364 RepID=A0A2P6NP79_9EUKA|nr:uroporphyrinogen-III synthase [Planoprotostelium fungivorum]